jgi:hypothetical protein
MIDFQNGSFFKLKKCDNSVADDMLPLFINGEEIIGCYKSIRDHVVFTNKRIISVNVQGITGKKKDYTSMPYAKIQVFSIETAGILDLDSVLSCISAYREGKIRILRRQRHHPNREVIGEFT